MDSKKTPTPAADFWAKVFLDRYHECMKAIKRDGTEACTHLAADQADLALAEFNKRFGAKS